MHFMQSLRTLTGVLSLSGLLLTANVQAMDVAGMKVDETAKIGNSDLKLNGAGIRYKAFFKVYVAALYLPEKKTAVNDIIALPGAKQVSIIALRDISSEDFGQAFMAGIRKNSDKIELSKYINQMLQFGQLFASVPEIKKGDILTMDWVPGTGTMLQLNGKKITEVIPDVGFYNAVLRIWLGNNPADEKLKRAMTGDKAEESGSSNR